MREFALLLLLVNLGFAAWSYWIAPRGAPAAALESDSGVPPLVLYSELGSPGDGEPALTSISPGVEEDAGLPTGSDAAQTDPDAATVAPARRCVSLGPFLDLSEAGNAAARLRQSGFDSAQRLAESSIWMGHWVYLPRYESRAAAVSAVEAMRAEGVSDLYIEPGGELRNMVSLGLFSDPARAETRAAEIRGLGYAPEIRDRYRSAEVYWIDFELQPDEEVSLNEFPAGRNRIIRLEARECPDDSDIEEPAGSPSA